MKPQKQAFKYNPPEGHGDCFRTAIASLLDLDRDDVPFFSGLNWLTDAEKWLNERGLTFFEFPIPGNVNVDSILSGMGELNPDIYYLLAGKSPRGCNHQVIALNDKIVCDPAQEGGGLVGPCIRTGYYWVGLLLPAAIHLERK